MIGIVKFFDPKKGYGFIAGGSADVFLHVQQLRESRFEGTPNAGDQLTFDTKEGERGPRAINVRRV